MSKEVRLYKERFTSIGFIRKNSGYKGHAKVEIEEHYIADFKEQKFVFLKMEGCMIPYEVESCEVKHDVLVKFKDIDSLEALRPYHKMSLYLLQKDLKSGAEAAEKNDQLNALVGMTINDVELGEIGKVARIDEYPQQSMAVIIQEDGHEILIPLHPDLIVNISSDEKVINMDLPEGLI